VAGQLPDQLGAALLSAAHEAFIQGLQLTSVIGAVVMIGLAILTMILLRQVQMPSEPEDQTEPEASVRRPALPAQPDIHPC
jgi:DHA2 family multidrug resistance protein-like MFS transporter